MLRGDSEFEEIVDKVLADNRDPFVPIRRDDLSDGDDDED